MTCVLPCLCCDNADSVILAQRYLSVVCHDIRVALCVLCLCMQCANWGHGPEVLQLRGTLVSVGRDILAVVQDAACWRYTATVSTQGTQAGR
jgi:hypothetical protein